MEERPDKAPHFRGVLVPLALTLETQAAVTMAAITVPVVAIRVAAELEISPAWVGVYASLAYGGGMLGSLFGGGLIARFGGVRVTQVGLGFSILGLVVSLPGAVVLLALGAFMMGLGFGPATPASSHILARHAPPKALSLVFSIKQTGVPLGTALAGAIAPSLALAFGWRGALVGAALFCLASLAACQLCRARYDVDRNPHAPAIRGNPFAPLGLILADPALRELSVISFFFAGVQQSINTFLVTHLVQNAGQDLVSAGLALSIAQVAGMVARLASGTLADRIGHSREILAAMGLASGLLAVTMWLISPGWSFAAIAATVALYGAMGIGWNGIFLAEIARRAPPGRAGEATGGSLFFTFAGVVAFPPLFALVTGLIPVTGVGYLAVSLPVGLYSLFVLLRAARAR